MAIEYKAVGESSPEVVNVNESYLEHRYMWTLCRDFIKGDAAVKRKNEVYLPIPSGFLIKDDTALASINNAYNQSYNFDKKYDFVSSSIYDDPNYHPNAPYSIYKHGAKTPAILKHTVNGLLGLIAKKPMEFFNSDQEIDKLPAGFNEDLWLEKIRKIITSTLSFGRCFTTLDENDIPVVYDALDVPNWRQGEYVNFIETKEGYDENLEISNDPIEFVRISQLASTTNYERFDSSGKLLKRKQTTKFKEIPVMCIGSTDLDWGVDILPLEGIATCALHIYKKTADLSYSEFSSCVPTLVMTGVDDDAGNKLIGGGVALSITSEMAKVYYATTDTNALQHVKIHIDGLFEEAKTYGASLLGGDKQEVESAEAIRLRQGAAGASLTTLTRNVELGINKLLQLANIDVIFAINFDLEENYLTPAEQSALLDAWMSNGISYSTYFNKMQKAGNIKDDRTIEEEKAEIEEEKEEKIKVAQEAIEHASALSASESVSKDDNVKGTGSSRTKNFNREGADYQK